MNNYQEEVLKAIDNLAAEVARVQQLVEQAFPVSAEKPSVDEVVTYEGHPYKIVDRLAQEGDVVVFTDKVTPTRWLQRNEPYIVRNENFYGLAVEGTGGRVGSVYSDFHNRTPETVKVYAPTTWEAVQEQAKQDVQKRIIRCGHVAPIPTPNERRAELIERAKQFVAEQRKQHMLRIGYFKMDHAVVVLHITGDGEWNEGHATIEEDAVFNLDIAKAIAVGRVLGIDVSEYTNAVQPSHYAVGQIVVRHDEINPTQYSVLEIGLGRTLSIVGTEDFAHCDTTKPLSYEGVNTRALKVIDDTNAQY